MSTAATLLRGPRGVTLALETIGAWLLALLWVLPLVYAFWTAFHPSEFSTRFVLSAPWTLDNFVKAMKAENAERAKFMAAAPPSSGFAKWNAYKTAKAKCASDQVKDDSTQARLQREMMAEATAGKADNIQKFTEAMTALGTAAQARSQRCNSLARPTFSQEDYNAAYAEDNREAAAGAAAAGNSPFVYARLKERVIAYTLMPGGWKANGYTADELHAIDARKPEIKSLLGTDFNSSGQRTPVGSG